VEVVSPPAP